MELQRLKEIINKAGFSPEILLRFNQILDNTIKNGHLSREDKAEMIALIDLEIECANVEADAMEEVALALESFADEIVNAQNVAGNTPNEGRKLQRSAF